MFVIAAFCLAIAACTSSVKDAKGKTEALLPRKDSLALAKLYGDYEKEVKDFQEEAQYMDITSEAYNRHMEKLKTDFETSLTGNPSFAPVVELRNLLIDYQIEKGKDEKGKYDVDLKLEEDMPEEFVWHEKELYFQNKWDEKLMKLLQEHPGFLECPSYMFDETLDMDIEVVTSADGRIRYYSWLSSQWRNVASITCIRQYRSDCGQIFVSKVENDDSWGGVRDVHTLDVDGEAIYLLKKTRNEGYFYITYHAEAIEGDKITNPIIFDTKDKKDPYVKFNLNGPRKDWVTKYNDNTKTIYIRVTNEEGDYYLNDAYVTYSFDGKMFRLSGQFKE